MARPKQKKNESDADYALRLEQSKKAERERCRRYYEAHKEAVKERVRKYSEANKEAVKEREHKYREANREAIRKRGRKWYAANKEVVMERSRKWYEDNKKAASERGRKYREANREVIREQERKRHEAKVLANAKGKPLQSNLKRAHRPRMLSRLVIKVAEDFCRNYGFPLECKWDTDVLKHASNTIRNSPELDGAANPWYGTDWLHPAVVTSKWTQDFRRSWRDKA